MSKNAQNEVDFSPAYSNH